MTGKDKDEKPVQAKAQPARSTFLKSITLIKEGKSGQTRNFVRKDRIGRKG